MQKTGLSHAYIAGDEDAALLSTAAVCGNTSDTSGTVPCKACKHCDKAARNIHPDVITVTKHSDKKEFTVDLIRSLKKDIYIAPNEAERKAYIIEDAHLMNPEAQNSFLQMLEDPPSHVVFILKTDTPSALLPTVRSRCVTVRTSPITEQSEIEDPDGIGELTDSFIGALGDNLKLTQCMFMLEKITKQDVTLFITLTRRRLSREIRKNPQQEKLIMAETLLNKALRMLDLNVNTGHISGMLCASLMDTEA